MIIRIRTLFPEFYNEFKKTSVIGRAIENKVVNFQTIDLKKYSRKNHRVDGHPIGGGAGRIIRMEPLVNCLRENTEKSTYKIRMSPKGHPYTQKDAIRFSKRDDICIICGHYEGIDARFEDYVDEQVSVGDYILSGGEIPARLISDSIIRLLKGAIADDSTKEESFSNTILEYPQYTYPLDFEGKKIPEILFCGNHKIIDDYHRKQARKDTYKYRKDLFDQRVYTRRDSKLWEEIQTGEELSPAEKQAMENGKKFLPKEGR